MSPFGVRLRSREGGRRWLAGQRGPTAPPGSDVSETEQALAESNERYLSLFAYSPHAAFSIDLDGIFVDANAVAQDLSGYSIEEFRDTDFASLLLPEHLARAVAAFEGALARVPQQLEATMVTKDGRHMELNLAAVPIIVGDEVVGVHGTAEDITEQNEMRRELERTRRRPRRPTPPSRCSWPT